MGTRMSFRVHIHAYSSELVSNKSYEASQVEFAIHAKDGAPMGMASCKRQDSGYSCEKITHVSTLAMAGT
jgi:hypothetical protein